MFTRPDASMYSASVDVPSVTNVPVLPFPAWMQTVRSAGRTIDPSEVGVLPMVVAPGHWPDCADGAANAVLTAEMATR